MGGTALTATVTGRGPLDFTAAGGTPGPGWDSG
jgi:hypothetical protein